LAPAFDEDVSPARSDEPVFEVVAASQVVASPVTVEKPSHQGAALERSHLLPASLIKAAKEHNAHIQPNASIRTEQSQTDGIAFYHGGEFVEGGGQHPPGYEIANVPFIAVHRIQQVDPPLRSEHVPPGSDIKAMEWTHRVPAGIPECPHDVGGRPCRPDCPLALLRLKGTQ
jgi:hypothetical protein